MEHPTIKLGELRKRGEEELSKDRIIVGLATCGISAGALPVFESLRSAGLPYEVDKTGCVGMCYAEPLVTVIKEGKKTIYGYVSEENVNDLIDSIKQNKKHKSLFLAHELEELEFYKKQLR